MLILVLHTNHPSLQLQSLSFWKPLLKITVVKVTILVNQTTNSISASVFECALVSIRVEDFNPVTVFVPVEEFALVLDLPEFGGVVVLFD
jgi:hypothetical protein